MNTDEDKIRSTIAGLLHTSANLHFTNLHAPCRQGRITFFIGWLKKSTTSLTSYYMRKSTSVR